jgi:hypothetical protein
MYVCIGGEEKKEDEKARRVYLSGCVRLLYLTYSLIVAGATRRACSYLLHRPLLFR